MKSFIISEYPFGYTIHKQPSSLNIQTAKQSQDQAQCNIPPYDNTTQTEIKIYQKNYPINKNRNDYMLTQQEFTTKINENKDTNIVNVTKKELFYDKTNTKYKELFKFYSQTYSTMDAALIV